MDFANFDKKNLGFFREQLRDMITDNYGYDIAHRELEISWVYKPLTMEENPVGVWGDISETPNILYFGDILVNGYVSNFLVGLHVYMKDNVQFSWVSNRGTADSEMEYNFDMENMLFNAIEFNSNTALNTLTGFPNIGSVDYNNSTSISKSSVYHKLDSTQVLRYYLALKDSTQLKDITDRDYFIEVIRLNNGKFKLTALDIVFRGIQITI